MLTYLVHELDTKIGCSDLVAFVQNSDISKTRMCKMGYHMKMNFDYIQIQKWMSRTVKAKKLDG